MFEFLVSDVAGPNFVFQFLRSWWKKSVSNLIGFWVKRRLNKTVKNLIKNWMMNFGNDKEINIKYKHE